VALCCKVQGAADTSLQRMAGLEERLLQLAVDRHDSLSATGILGTTGGGREGTVGGAVTVQSQSGKVTPRSPSSMLTGMLMGATRSRQSRERASSTPTPTCSGTKSPATTAPQPAKVSAVALLEAAGAAARRHASEGSQSTPDATPSAFLEACHLPAATRSVSLTGSARHSARHESIGEGKTKRPHTSRTPTLRPEARTESDLNSAWRAARSEHFGCQARLGSFLPGDSLTLAHTASLEPFPSVPRPASPLAPEQGMLDIDPARDTAEHLLRQQRLQEWQHRSRPREEAILRGGPREEAILRGALVPAGTRAPGASDKKGADEEAVMIF